MNRSAAAMPLRFLHIGDLHITQPDLENHRDLAEIIDQANAHLTGQIDFAILPGDIADDGTPEQFRLVRRELDRLTIPWYAIPGDHDFKPTSLDNFYAGLGARRLPHTETIARTRCLFLDFVSAGTGGPDFRLGAEQTRWLQGQLEEAQRTAMPTVIFMHGYPADLCDGASEVAAMIDGSPTVLVDMGHTHYNELSNDGRTIYAATRSTGQIEEGDVGFSLAAVDGNCVSWRFKPLASTWPFVMITAPADRRLAIDSVCDGPAEGFLVRAITFGAAPVRAVECKLDGGAWHDMQACGNSLYAVDELAAPDHKADICVRVIDSRGNEDIDTICFAPQRDARPSFGNDQASIGAWPERYVLGTQLGPNRNGRKW